MSNTLQLTIGVLGLGQIGGSLCAALKRDRSQYCVLAFDPNRVLQAAAIERSVIDRLCEDEQRLIDSSDVVILATHIDTTIELLRSYQNSLKEKQLVFDVASIKSEICETAVKLGLQNFVGGHPIAGTEQIPPDAWDMELFQSARFLYCSPVDAPKTTAQLFSEILTSINAIGEAIAPEHNDYQFGLTIGLPHVFAYTLRNMRLERVNAGQSFDALVGPSFRSATRVANSDPRMVEQMLWHNRRDLIAHLRTLEDSLAELRSSLEAGDSAALSKMIHHGK
jgi:prephenate dehydrogenase